MRLLSIILIFILAGCGAAGIPTLLSSPIGFEGQMTAEESDDSEEAESPKLDPIPQQFDDAQGTFDPPPGAVDTGVVVASTAPEIGGPVDIPVTPSKIRHIPLRPWLLALSHENSLLTIDGRPGCVPNVYSDHESEMEIINQTTGEGITAPIDQEEGSFFYAEIQMDLDDDILFRPLMAGDEWTNVILRFVEEVPHWFLVTDQGEELFYTGSMPIPVPTPPQPIHQPLPPESIGVPLPRPSIDPLPIQPINQISREDAFQPIPLNIFVQR